MTTTRTSEAGVRAKFVRYAAKLDELYPTVPAVHTANPYAWQSHAKQTCVVALDNMTTKNWPSFLWSLGFVEGMMFLRNIYTLDELGQAD